MTPVPAVARGRVLVGQQVVQTLVVCPRRSEVPTHFEVHVATDAGADAPRVVLITKDHALYQQASNAEATGERVDVEWLPGVRTDGLPAKVLRALWRSA